MLFIVCINSVLCIIDTNSFLYKTLNYNCKYSNNQLYKSLKYFNNIQIYTVLRMTEEQLNLFCRILKILNYSESI